MLKALWDDLRYAQTTGVVVEVSLLNGEKLLKGVHEVHEEDGFVSLYDPKMLGGKDLTTRKVDADLIMSVSVTDGQWREP